MKTDRGLAGGDGSRGAVVGLLVIALACLAAGIGLHTVRYLSHRDLIAARSWVETPCTMERCEFIRDDDDGAHLEVLYRYEVDGASYTSDRLDAVIGRMGDDDEFEERIQLLYPAGSTTVCYIDPEDPSRAVLDRHHGADAPRRMWLLAFPFTCVGLVFLVMLIASLLPGTPSPPGDIDIESSGARFEQAPPRNISLLTRLSILSGTTSSQLVWFFLVGFVFVFIILDGPASYARLFNWHIGEASTTGRVIDAREIDAREFHAIVHQFRVAYDVDGSTYETIGFARGEPYDEGETVEVLYDPDAPSKGRIAGMRESEFTWWHSLIPLGVVLLLLLGIQGMYRRNYRVQWLLKHGLVTRTRWVAPDPSDPDDELQRATLISHYCFDVNGRTYRAMHYDAPAKARRRTKPDDGEAAAPRVLYRAGKPKWNVIADEALIKAIQSRRTADRIIDVVTAPVGIVVLLILFRGAELM